MGYSMGSRIAAFLSVTRPARVRSAILGGLGIRLVEGVGLPESIAEALEAPTVADVKDPTGRTFRVFAEQTKSDLRALAACIRGSRQTLSRAEVAAIVAPVLVAVGTPTRWQAMPRNWPRSFRGHGHSIFPAATTCLLSAIRTSKPPLSISLTNAHEPKARAMRRALVRHALSLFRTLWRTWRLRKCDKRPMS